MSKIHFFNEEISFKHPKPAAIIKWLSQVASQEGREILEINYIFCSDQYLLNINQTYLEHDYYTDIITFDHSESAAGIISDIFISIDRVKENADGLGTDFNSELHRVMVHGLLHLCGYSDATDDDKTLMRQKEDTCLSLLNFAK